MKQKIELIIIDPQSDFCDPKGALYVAGANDDMQNVADLLNRAGDRYNDIHVTLDSHHFLDIAHPIFWVNSKGENPEPFTIIEVDDVLNGKWTTFLPQYTKYGLEYVTALKDNGRYPLCIWPPHCLIGSWGFGIYPPLYDALLDWEKRNPGSYVNFLTKGSNILTEHYSAVKADVPDPEDPTTEMNFDFIDPLKEADQLDLSGEALSHCLANTVNDIAAGFGDDSYIQKFNLLEGASSNVTGFEFLGEGFVKDMTSRGMKTTPIKTYEVNLV
jgi:nicotinamidase/pyrazinamidase